MDMDSSVWRISRECLMYTCAHGIPHIFRSRHWLQRLFWTLFVLAAMCCAFWQCSETVIRFYSYPSHERISLVSASEMEFPAVTICNLNSVRRSAVTRHHSIVSSITKYCTDRRENETSDSSPESKAASCTAPRSRFASMFNLLTDRQRQEIGHQLDDMLISCQYHGESCNTSFFSGFINYKFGNCYTFNSKRLRDIESKSFGGSVPKTSRAGLGYGLHLELFIQQDEYMREITHSAGIRLLIHHPTRMPLPEDQGITIAPGIETDISMTWTQIERLPSPYESKCSHGDGLSDYYCDLHGSTYSTETCEKTCAQQSIMKNCGCSHWEFPMAPWLVFPKCNYSDKMTRTCLDLYEFKYAHDMLSCHCPLQCREDSYDLTISGSQWPASAFMEKFSSNLKRMDSDELHAIADDPLLIRDNFLKVVVYYEKLNYERIVEEPSITAVDLFSNIGGLVGLWVGFSLCTVAELVEFLISIFLTAFRGLLHTRAKRYCKHPNPDPIKHISGVQLPQI